MCEVQKASNFMRVKFACICQTSVCFNVFQSLFSQVVVNSVNDPPILSSNLKLH
jgi:hypothetical protein